MMTDSSTRASAESIALAGDHLNADHFLAAHGQRVKYSPELDRWFTWSGAWWEEDRLEQVPELARYVIDGLRAWAGEADNSGEFTQRSAHYRASAKASRALALLQVVRTRPYVAVAVAELDQHPILLPRRNGTVDLQTGVLLPADRAQLLTQGVQLDYSPDAHSELWERFLTTTFGGDQDLIAYLQRVLGYACTGVVAEHIAPVFYGTGANGKSTLVGVAQDLLGDLALTAPEGLFSVSQNQPHPERIAVLRGKRLVVSYELEQRVTLAEAKIKALTGGDRLSARELYGRRFDFAPSHKVVVICNHRPRVHGTDESIWRRLRLVPFEHTVPPESQDSDLRRRLVADHGRAILAWLVKGAVEWANHGLGEAKAVTLATATYRAEQDIPQAFLDVCTEAQPRGCIKVGDLWHTWKEWCDSVGERPGRLSAFTSALQEHGVRVETDSHNARWAHDLIFSEGSLGFTRKVPASARVEEVAGEPSSTLGANSGNGIRSNWPDGSLYAGIESGS